VSAKVDVAIVGGGVSGAYCAWRLRQADPAKTIVLVEGTDHVGGRLLSVQPPEIDYMVAELGGMRILPAVQPLINALIGVLNGLLPRDQRIETYEFPVDEDQNIAYLRGSWLRLADFRDPSKVPYHLPFLEAGNTPGMIMVGAIEQIVPGITTEPNEERRRAMCQAAHFAGRPLYEQGFWNVLARIISGEAYQLGVDAGGYSSTLSNWNAADAIPWYLSDFGIEPKYLGFKRGFQQVPKTLAELFRRDGGEIRLSTKLLGFAWSDDGRARLRLSDGELDAGALILAMPRRSLELLAPASPPLQPNRIQELIASVTPRPLFKIFTTYDNPWWRAAGYTNARKEFVPVEAGRTVTDLPVRQTYYWPRDDGKPATSGPAMLMASYDDGANIGYWDGLRARRHQAWEHGLEVPVPEQPYASQDHGAADGWARYEASQAMVEEVNRQLGRIHGLPFTPAVRNAAFRDWGDDPFGGGWNSWNIGVRSPEVKHSIVQPIEDRPLYICGEAYSDAQGWVEGALQTADLVLEKFALKPLTAELAAV